MSSDRRIGAGRCRGWLRSGKPGRPDGTAGEEGGGNAAGTAAGRAGNAAGHGRTS
jgi:hypothetical protein